MEIGDPHYNTVNRMKHLYKTDEHGVFKIEFFLFDDPDTDVGAVLVHDLPPHTKICAEVTTGVE